MQSKENLIHFHLCRIQYFTFQILTETRILILDQEAWGQNISFLELVLWLLMALDGPVKSILMRLGFEGLSSCAPREGCEKIKVWKLISKLKHQQLNIEPQKGTDWMKRSYHWIYFSQLIQCPTLWHCFFLRACNFSRARNWCNFEPFLPTCHPFDTINRITCHEAFMRNKKSGFKVVGK